MPSRVRVEGRAVRPHRERSVIGVRSILICEARHPAPIVGSSIIDTDLARRIAEAGALIFDCDGTLVDTVPVYTRAWAAALSLSGQRMTAAWYATRSGLSEHVLMDQFEAEHRITLDRDRTVERLRDAFLKELSGLGEIAAVAGIARRNRGMRPMAVASGGSAAIVGPSLRVTGLASLFDAVVTLDDGGRAKPEPDLFLEAARRLVVPPERCLVFEDSPQGLEAARRAGMSVIDVADLPGR